MTATALIVMGPSGVGKTTTALILARALGWPCLEGDDLHPRANIEKMARGEPLDDADRLPWLAAIRDRISEQAEAGGGLVATCSALKRRYRDLLREARADLRFVELLADRRLAGERLAARRGHFMPAALLESQFAAFEALQADEPGVRIAADAPPEAVAARALAALGLEPRFRF